MILEALAKRNTEWLKMANKFSDTPEDALQDAYLKIYDRFKDCPQDLLSKDEGQVSMYMYLTLRSCASDNYHRDNKYADLPDHLEEDEEYNLELDRLTERQLDLIHNTINSWHWYDKKLFRLHFIEGHSMRSLSRETNISLANIFYTIKTCKQRLRTKLSEL